jgi:hypothetical protein
MDSVRARIAGPVLALVVVVGGVTGAAAQEGTFEPNSRPHSVAIDWVEAMLTGIEHNPPAPTATTWRMFVVLSSMFDAWAAYDEDAIGTVTGSALRRPIVEHTEVNQEHAVSFAAYSALGYIFPDETDLFDAVLEHHGLEPSPSVDPATPAGIGNIVAAQVIRRHSMRGANAFDFAAVAGSGPGAAYEPDTAGDPNHWVPLQVPNGTVTDVDGNPTMSEDDPHSYETQEFLTPHWGEVPTFALRNGHELRPVAPPRLGSDEPYVDARGRHTTNDAAFRAQAAEVLGLSGNLDDEHKVIAEFWADGPHTWTPPGHWIQLAIGVSLRDEHSVGQDVCMYLALAGALFDAGVAAWDAKRAYDYVRPATAIPYLYAGEQVRAWLGPDKGIGLIEGKDWRPYQAATFVTPPFAEYVSGHSAFSAAAAEILTRYSGSADMYDGTTRLGRDYDGDGTEDTFGQHVATPGTLQFEHGPASPVVLRWSTFRDAADEAGRSRLYGGIHFQDGDLRGRVLGREVGRRAFAAAEAHWEITAS